MTALHRSTAIGLALFAVVLTGFARAMTVLRPGPFDASLYAFIGDNWLGGRIPYLHIWDNKPPAIFAVSAVGRALTPDSFVGIAAIEYVAILGFVAVVVALLRQLQAPAATVVLGGAMAAVMANLSAFNQHGHLTEVYLLLPAAASILLFIRGLAGNRACFLMVAGVCTGLALSFKMVGVAPLLAQLAVLGLGVVTRRRGLSVTFRIVALLLAGVSAALVPWWLYFASHGVGAEWAAVTLWYPFFYGAENQQGVFVSLQSAVGVLQPVSSLIIAAVVGASVVLWPAPEGRGPSREVSWLFALWLFADTSGALAGGRGYGHYFLAMTGSVSVCAALAYWRWVDAPLAERVHKAVLAVVWLSSPALAQVHDLTELAAAIREPVQPSVMVVYLREHAEPDDTLFSWDYRPWVYLQTGLQSPHRLVSTLNARDSQRVREDVASDLMDALLAAPPTYVIGTREPVPPGYETQFRRWHSLLGERYVLIEGGGGLYRRRERRSDSLGGLR